MKTGNPHGVGFIVATLLLAATLPTITITAHAEIRHVIYADTSRAPSLGDLDGDGDMDIFLRVPLRWFENDGSGNFAEHTLVNPGTGLGHSAISDIDGDGDLDLIASTSDLWNETVSFYFWENDGYGVFTLHDFSYQDTRPQRHEFVVDDFDNDDDADIFLTKSLSHTFDGFPIQPLYLENIGNWDFTVHHLDYEPPYTPPACVADFNNDGLLDVAVCKTEYSPGIDSEYEVIIFENNGFPLFIERGVDADFLQGGRGIGPDDFNSDGRYDIVYSGGTSGNLKTYLFESTNIDWNFSLGIVDDSEHGVIDVCDYNVDGFSDLVIGSENDVDWNIRVWYGDGDGSFPKHKFGFLNYDASSYEIVSGDLDSDGDPDIIDTFVHTPDAFLGWWENERINPYVSIVLEPDTDPVIVPATGGIISYSATIENRLLFFRSCVATGRIQIPNGTMYTLWSQPVTLQPSVPISVDNIEQSIPAGAPAGDYRFYVVLGWPNLPLSPKYYGSFDFVKQP